MTCTTHHHACDCREKLIRDALEFALESLDSHAIGEDAALLRDMMDGLYRTTPSPTPSNHQPSPPNK